MTDINPEIAKAQSEITLASIWSELRLLDFTEEEIAEIKAMKYDVGYLGVYVELARGGLELMSNELEQSLGIRRNQD